MIETQASVVYVKLISQSLTGGLKKIKKTLGTGQCVGIRTGKLLETGQNLYLPLIRLYGWSRLVEESRL
jgi:hypothetical protein